MGTSARYDAPPAWGPLKSVVTRTGGQPLSQPEIANVLSTHIRNNGGPSAVASGGGVLGSGRTPQRVAQKLAGFLAEVGSTGVRAALEGAGLAALVGKPAHEVAMALVRLCGVEDGSIDAVDANNAHSRLMDELFQGAETPQQVEEVLLSRSDFSSILELMVKFYGYYLYEQFCRVFYEQLVQKHGDDRADGLLNQVRDYIVSSLRHHRASSDGEAMDWSSAEAARLADRILRETLEVFSV